VQRFVFSLFVAFACVVPHGVRAQSATAPVPPALAPSAAPSSSPEPSPTPPYNRIGFRGIGPAVAGGRVTSVVGVADDPKLYYLGSAGGGVWKTQNGGATWKPVFDAQDVASIGAVAVDPRDHDIVWVGTGETNPRNDVTWGDGIYRSANGGKTWTNLGLADTKYIASIAIDPHDSNKVVVGALGDVFADSPDRGVFRTTDGGKTWTKTLYVGPRSGVSELVADPVDPNVMYAGIWHFQRRPWTFESGGVDAGIYKSPDAGATWTQLRGHGLPEGMLGRIGLAVAPSNHHRVYALIESQTAGILWRSDDDGANWTLATKNTLVDQRFFYFSHLRVDPANADHVYGVSEELSESKDAGKTFKSIAEGVHVDYHDMWIAPNDSKRMIVGEDGGYAISLDGSAWAFSRNVPIAQIYHIGYDDRNPYSLCVGLQDNNGFCGPSNSLRSDGIPDEAWDRVVGGDGQWAWPDPRDPNLVWTDLQDGRLLLYDRAAQRSRPILAHIATAAQNFSPATLAYRFNWDSPIAFDPFDRTVGYFGGNVVFATRDRGTTWKPISPDLTRNDKAHQIPSGGPLALDNTGAEATDTLLDIEPSTLTRGEIWTGSDDGLVELTRDGGTHWTNVTPPGVPRDGRAEVVAPSAVARGTAYVVIARHYFGDHTPYVFVTHDDGRSWTSIASGLPMQEARAIRPDTRNAHLVYLGLENSFWLSYDDGAHWRKAALGLPTTASYDIRIQPHWNDLIVATHGRGAYVLDDLTPIQQLPRAEAAGTMLFAPRTAYLYALHANDEGLYTRFAGKNPPPGALVSFYQSRPAAQPPEITILDAAGRTVRTIRGTHRVDGKDVPLVTNFAGINRVAWDLHEDGPVRWDGAAKDDFKGPRSGATVVPGRYTVRVTLAGHTYSEPLVVAGDPRVHISQDAFVAMHRIAAAQFRTFSSIDAALNRLDAYVVSARARATAAPALAPMLEALRTHALALRSKLTADFTNDEDSIGRPGAVREDVEGTLNFGSAPVNAAALTYEREVDATAARVLADVAAFERTDVATANAALVRAGDAPLQTSGAKRVDVTGTAAADDDDGDAAGEGD